MAAARARLATGGQIRLSELGELDPDAFGLFLQLLGDALATWWPGTVMTTASSGDGSMEIRLTALADPAALRVKSPHAGWRVPLARPPDRDHRSDGGGPRVSPVEVLEGQHAAEVRRAARALLRRPLLLATGVSAEDFRLVRKHASELRTWFDRNTGWPLRVDAGSARLVPYAPRRTTTRRTRRGRCTGLPHRSPAAAMCCCALPGGAGTGRGTARARTSRPAGRAGGVRSATDHGRDRVHAGAPGRASGPGGSGPAAAGARRAAPGGGRGGGVRQRHRRRALRRGAPGAGGAVSRSARRLDRTRGGFRGAAGRAVGHRRTRQRRAALPRSVSR